LSSKFARARVGRRNAADGDRAALTATKGCGALVLFIGSLGDAMNNSAGILDVSDHDVFGEEISDAALELAAAMVRDRTASLTIAFCSGLDECPRHGPRVVASSQVTVGLNVTMPPENNAIALS
jgi:hypothetical protein